MLRALLLLVLLGCAPAPGRIPALARARPATGPRVSFAVVGGTAGGGAAVHAVVADVAAAAARGEVDFVVLLGDQVRRSSPREWTAAAARWRPVAAAGAGLWMLAGPGEERGAGHFSAFAAASGRTVPWEARTVRPGGKAWRLVGLETDRRAMGTRWADQQYWLPRAVGGPAPLLLFVPGGPDADAVLAAALDDASPTSPVAIWRPGPKSAVELPGGPFSTARIAVVPAASDAGIAASSGSATPGWWRVDLRGTEIDLAYRPCPTGGPIHGPRPWRYLPDTGWQQLDAGGLP